jgi:hypothetical protein
MKHRVTRLNLKAVHEGMRVLVQQWASGLITDKEIADAFAVISSKFATLDNHGLLVGMIDPNTGLRFIQKG